MGFILGFVCGAITTVGALSAFGGIIIWFLPRARAAYNGPYREG